ncbi:MAG: glycine--tRNA ligase subunit beta [Gammaproteobacteria bacterium RIFCSPHIGHO2_12_FULL_45_9]|nr:MAG: glycine--tRNA ligase subunit beta [Gammaproteobacteria bacterium RIFCSPHIGHO2_12_FULL_45_9]
MTDFLFELGTAELPASSIPSLAEALQKNLEQAFQQTGITFKGAQSFATPRRLSVFFSQVAEEQPPQSVERLGPRIDAAYDREHQPTMACLGFAQSCGVAVSALTMVDTPKGSRVACQVTQPGRATLAALPELIQQAVARLSIAKPMRWGTHPDAFLRPIQWVVALFGKTVVDVAVFGKQATRETRGHRFHHPKPLNIPDARDYVTVLFSYGHVIGDFHKRRDKIKTALRQIETQSPEPLRVEVDEALLDEVTGLVEWPVPLCGTFDTRFLAVPPEVLITSIKTHQKCFPIWNSAKHQLEPRFVVIANLQSKDPKAVIAGNEKVIHARLSDALFFFEKDLATPLSAHRESLKTVIFQKSLGSLWDKTERLAALAIQLAPHFGIEPQDATQAAQLSKCDLRTLVVGEFPELQGIMGDYYARLSGEATSAVAIALKEQYWPRFSQDALPNTSLGKILALADRLDTLMGIFGIGLLPSGDKDPFALRRAALGVVRLLLDQPDLSLQTLLSWAYAGYQQQGVSLSNATVLTDVENFVLERLKYFMLERGTEPAVFAAVAAIHPASLGDFEKRLAAVQRFQQLPVAAALAAAHKRVNNLLKKQTDHSYQRVQATYFQHPAEQHLFSEIETQKKQVETAYRAGHYTEALTHLALLKPTVDAFFDEVMVMVEDPQIRNNRLALLADLQHLFMQVADLSELNIP